MKKQKTKKMKKQKQAQSLNNNNNLSSEVASPKGRHFLLKAGFWLPILVMALTAVLFNLFPIDIKVQSHYFSDGWRLNSNWLVQLLYKFSNIPALITVLASLFFLALGYKQGHGSARYRKIFIYLIIVMVVGPGLIVNAALKDHWGRPRPRDIQEFGGKYPYEAPLEMNRDTPGKSFPSGHASMGYYLFALAFALKAFSLRKYRLMTIFTLLYGSLIGWGRIVQGGHFMSDVIFSGAILYLVAHLSWHIMKLENSPFYIPKEGGKKLSPKILILIIISAIIILIGFGLATPYNRSQTITLKTDEPDNLKINLKNTELSFALSDSTYISGINRGFGFPGSKSRLKYKETDGVHYIDQELKGFFSELQSITVITIDSLKVRNFSLNIEAGEMSLDLNPNWLMIKDEPTGAYQLNNGDENRNYIFNIKDAKIELN